MDILGDVMMDLVSGINLTDLVEAADAPQPLGNCKTRAATDTVEGQAGGREASSFCRSHHNSSMQHDTDQRDGIGIQRWEREGVCSWLCLCM